MEMEHEGDEADGPKRNDEDDLPLAVQEFGEFLLKLSGVHGQSLLGLLEWRFDHKLQLHNWQQLDLNRPAS